MTIQRNTITAPCFRRQTTQSCCIGNVTDAATGLWVPPSCEAPANSTNARRLGTDAQGKDGAWKARGKPNDAKRMCLPRIGHRGTYAPHSGGQRACLTRGQARQQEHRARKRGQLEVAPRNYRDASHRSGMARETPADTLARWRRLAQSGVAAHKPRALAGTPSSPHSSLTPPATPKRSTQRWQDSRAVRDSRGLCSEKGPSLARSTRYAFPKGDLQRFSDAWRANLAKISSFWTHSGDMLPGRGAFPVRGRFWDTWSAKLATDCRPGTHQDEILPSPSARERTVAPRSWETPHERNVNQFNKRAATRPTNRENILVPSTEKLR